MSPRRGTRGTTQPSACTNKEHVSTWAHILGGCWAACAQSQGCRAHHPAAAPVPALRLPRVGPWGLQGWWLLLHLWLWPRHGMPVFCLWALGTGTKPAGPGTAWFNPSLPLRSQIPALGSPSATCVCRQGLCQPAPALRYFGAVCPALVSATVEGEKAMSDRSGGGLWVLPWALPWVLPPRGR